MPNKPVLEVIRKYLKNENVGKEFFQNLTIPQQKELARTLLQNAKEAKDFTILLDEKDTLLEEFKKSDRKRKVLKYSVVFLLFFYLMVVFSVIFLTLFILKEQEYLLLLKGKIADRYLFLLSNLGVACLPLNIFFLLPLVFSLFLTIFNRKKKKRVDLLEECILKIFEPVGIGKGEEVKIQEMLEAVKKHEKKLIDLNIRGLGRSLKKLGFKKKYEQQEGYFYHIKKKRKWL